MVVSHFSDYDDLFVPYLYLVIGSLEQVTSFFAKMGLPRRGHKFKALLTGTPRRSL